jgi:cation diffusion facilitator family transporter
VYFSTGVANCCTVAGDAASAVPVHHRRTRTGAPGSRYTTGAFAGIVNAGLGYYLLHIGRRTNSTILEADGKHVLADSWTSFGVVGGLGLVLLTQWKPLDPLVAIAVAANILWSGGQLVWRSALGLLDYSDPSAGRIIRDKLDTICAELQIQYHGVRFRTTGCRQIVEVHLLFPQATTVSEAHRLATILEERLPAELDVPAELVTHLES